MLENVLVILQEYFWKIITAIIILLVGFGIGIFAKKLLNKALKEVGLNKILLKVGVRYNTEVIMSNIISYLIFLVTIVVALDTLGITSIVIYLLLGAVLMLLILSFLVGAKDIIPNFIAWLVLQRKGKIVIGKSIKVKEISGRVEKIGYLETEIKTEHGDVLYVPNNLFLKTKFWVKKKD
ncbi:MAG: mechanosensitive ion channel domain-containing protein [archaeon]